MSEEWKQIEAVLDEKVRPSLRAHGGELEIDHLEDGVLYIKLLGQCAGCPSADLTNETLIEHELTAALPELVQKYPYDPAKAKGAAHTYALKYYLFEKFTVDQGEDDPDNSDFGAQGKGSGAGGRQQATQGRQGQGSGRLSDAQLARLYKKAEAAGMTKERTNARIVEKYKKQDPAALTRQEYDEICTSLDNAAAQHNQQGGNA